jgi:serine/threonine protein kinase
MDNIQQKSIWPGWETVRIIGRGSYGAVYEVRRHFGGTEERAAVKCLSIPQDPGEIRELRLSGYDQESLTRHFAELKDKLRQEYETMVRLKGNENVVACEDLRVEQHADGIGWDVAIRMELLTPLLDSLGERADESRVLRLARDMARALAACHGENIVHRDVKPQNIFVDRQGRYKLGDFGVARTMEGTGSATMRTGTYRYMAPEVFNGQHYGPRADLYSLGLVLYWLLNDRRSPFVPPPPHLPRLEDEERARARRVAGQPIPPPAHGSPALQRIVLKLLAFDPKGRYQSAGELLRELENVENSKYVPARRLAAPAGAVLPDDAKRPSPGGGRRQPPSHGRCPSDEGERSLPSAASGRGAPSSPASRELPPPGEAQRSRRRRGLIAGLAVAALLALVLIPLLAGAGKDKPAEPAPTGMQTPVSSDKPASPAPTRESSAPAQTPDADTTGGNGTTSSNVDPESVGQDTHYTFQEVDENGGGDNGGDIDWGDGWDDPTPTPNYDPEPVWDDPTPPTPTEQPWDPGFNFGDPTPTPTPTPNPEFDDPVLPPWDDPTPTP